jgi:hypothetical protein
MVAEQIRRTMNKAAIEARLGARLDEETFALLNRLPEPAAAFLDTCMNDLLKMLVPVLGTLHRKGYTAAYPHRSVWTFTHTTGTLTFFLETEALEVTFQHDEITEMLEFNANNYGRMQFHSWFREVFDETV